MPSPIPRVRGRDERDLARDPEVHPRVIDSEDRMPPAVEPPSTTDRRRPRARRPPCSLVRGREPWELLLVHRPGGADFAPGAYVFPGGTVHADDTGWGDEIRAAAVRELFEEVGILLARHGRRFARERDCDRSARSSRAGRASARRFASSALEPAFDRLVLLRALGHAGAAAPPVRRALLPGALPAEPGRCGRRRAR